jgi:hypothetical protein
MPFEDPRDPAPQGFARAQGLLIAGEQGLDLTAHGFIAHGLDLG